MPKQRPDKAFAEKAQSDGLISEFCEQNYEENAEACETLVADKLQQDPPAPPEQSTEPPEPEPEPQHDPVDDLIGSEDGIETLVADCAGGGFLSTPNTQSCMRAVAKYERDRRSD